MKGFSHVVLAIMIIFIASFTLFYVFDNLDKIAAQCNAGSKQFVCEQLNSFTVSVIFILLVIGGLVLSITAVVYIMLTA